MNPLENNSQVNEMVKGLNSAVDGVSKFMQLVQQQVTPEVLQAMTPEERAKYDKAIKDYNQQMSNLGTVADQMKNAIGKTYGV